MAGNSIQDLIWSLGFDVTIVDIDSTIQEVKVNDITLSGILLKEELSVDLDYDRVNVMDLDVNIVVDGINSSIVESQVVTYDRIKEINDLSPESTYEKGFASSAKAAKELHNLIAALGLKYDVLKSDVDKLEEAIENIEINPSDPDTPIVGDSYWKLGADGLLHSNYGIYVKGDAIFEGDTSSKGEGQDTPSAGIDEKRLQEYLEENKYVTEGYVDDAITTLNLSQYAKASDLDALQTEVDNIDAVLGLSETAEGYINTWAEVKAFLDGYKNADDLATILSGINADIAKNAESIATLDNDKADKATTLAGYGITDAYTKSDLESYKTWWDAVMGLVVKEGNNIRIKTNLIVEGDTSSGGSGSDTPALGTVTSIKVNNTPYNPNSAGVIDLSEAFNSIDVSDQLGDYAKTDYVNTQFALVNSALSGKQDALGYTPLSTSGGTISGSGYWSLKVKSTGQNAVGIGFEGADGRNGYLLYAGDSTYKVSDNGWHNLYTLYHTGNFNPADYLPKSGGMIESSSWGGQLTLKRSVSQGDVVLRFANNNGTLGYLGFNQKDTPFFMSAEGAVNTLIHSGNIGSYALKIAGTNARPILLTPYENLNDYGYGYYSYVNGNDPENQYGTNAVLFAFRSYRGNDTWQIAFDGNGINNTAGPNFAIRGNFADIGWTAWYRIATTSGNVASATKLQTARTIWGQSFDGTGKVSGDLSLGNGGILGGASSVNMLYYDTSNTLYLGYGMNGVGGSVICGNAIAMRYGSSRDMGFLLNSSGNVTIGSSDLAGTNWKLFSNGPASFWDNSRRTIDEHYIRRSAILQISSYSAQDNDSFFIGQLANATAWMQAAYGGGEANPSKNHTFPIALQPLGGNVLIGTTTDNGYKLDVNGTGNFSVGIKANEVLLGGAGLYKGSYWTSALSDNDMVINGGKISLTGAVTMSSTLNVTSSITSGANVNCVNLISSGDTSSGSDIRFKDIIKNKTIKIEDIANAPLFTFTWNDREDDTIHMGSSAQYWEKVTPWLVKGEDFKTLDYSTLGVAMGISLAKKAMNHEERIKVLEEENKALKAELNRISYGC